MSIYVFTCEHQTGSVLSDRLVLVSPPGSGLGYIVGSQVGSAAGDWHWALRVSLCRHVLVLCAAALRPLMTFVLHLCCRLLR